MSTEKARLHGFFRSSASWRVRIALHLKGVDYDQETYILKKAEHRAPRYMAFNPQGLVPALRIDGHFFTQSLAICEYLDETRPEPPLLPRQTHDRAHVRALAQIIACDVHPLQNLKVLQAIERLGHGEEGATEWARRVIDEGLAAFAALLVDSGAFCVGDVPTLADLALIPQLGNARRFGVDLRWPIFEAIEASCMALPAFRETAPDRQPDYMP